MLGPKILAGHALQELRVENQLKFAWRTRLGLLAPVLQELAIEHQRKYGAGSRLRSLGDMLRACSTSENLVPQIAIVNPPKPRLPHLLGGLPSFPSRWWGVWLSRR